MGAFNFKTNKAGKKFDIAVSGTFSEQDAVAFITQYNKETSAFAPKEYDIELDCTELNVSSQDVLPMLEQCYKLYIESGFKKVIFKIAKNVVLKMQLGRVARTTGLKNYEIIEVA